MEIKWGLTDFMRRSEYTAHLYVIENDYRDKFGNMINLNVKIEEQFPNEPINKNQKHWSFSEDGSTGIVALKLFNSSPNEVFKTILFVLGKASDDYQKQFNNDNL